MTKMIIRPTNPRDLLIARPKTYIDGPERTPGIGLYVGKYLVQFFTPAQALALANQITDTYAQMQAGEPNA